MPYIKKAARVPLHKDLKPINSGELNYKIHQVLAQYIDKNDLHYDMLNEVIGVLECVKLELYARLVRPYEDKKCAENGDIELYE